LELQASVKHYIHQAWYTLPLISPHVPINPSHGPPGLQPLDFKVIQWHILKDGVSLIKLFGGISFGLSIVLQFDIRVHRYYYVEKDPQARQASMQHIMLLQQHLELLLTSGLPTRFTKQHHIVGGAGFGQDRTSGLGHIKMGVLGFIIGWHKSRTFQP
jgi:hypothetical protein